MEFPWLLLFVRNDQNHIFLLNCMVYICGMKKLLAYLFIVGILMQTCSKQIIFVEYLYNKNYISTSKPIYKP